ncbi:MAG: eukaryotic-like serine/threonine-protein kinase [Acidobacteriota bacterium]|jgi:formylglycine-generating enzyme required for sulfatase activity|nr:eukaryotic-like serine/threonine-protein kinase [Acidobacteriota bacterium]
MIAPNTLLQNRYQIISQIGQGGMGAVYMARDQRLRSVVALKESFYSDEQMRRAFEREAALLANLHHPALPNVIDHFAEGDVQFLVMQFIPGEDLGAMMEIKGGPFAVDEVTTWADQLLDALDYLHTQAPPVLHRDIKPQNLKLTERGQVILLDFGLAKGTAGQMSSVGASRSVFGFTPHFAPLEQIQSAGTDARSDLYALAATLYYLMTAVAPSDALTRASSVIRGQPDPLRAASEVNAQIPARVSGVLHAAMAQNPDERPQTAALMREALREASSEARVASTESVLPATVTSHFTNQIGMEFVYVPVGSFMMGSEKTDCEKPVHQVTIRESFYMSKYEVTEAQWHQAMGSDPPDFNGDNLPVKGVAWIDAQNFIQQLNAMNNGYVYRLPTEAEWEYACRAGTTGDYAGNLDAMAWHIRNSGGQPHPVGQKQPNSFGLYDMHGNVDEWCEDVWHDSYNGAPTDGSAWLSGGQQNYRVLRGGWWDDRASYLRSAWRTYDDPRGRLPGEWEYHHHGFRVVAVSRSS